MFGNIRTIVKRNKVIDNACPLNIFSSYLYHATQCLRPLSFFMQCALQHEVEL